MRHDGDKGVFELIEAATSETGDKFAYLQAFEASVISFDIIATPGMGANAETSIANLPMPAGSVFYGGTLHNLDQESGRVIAYYK